jgi:hypothetical protein
MPDTASFVVDPRLASLLGESYRSTEQAIKELVDNAWDADAEDVEITLPTEMTDEPIIIQDNGSGMTEEELRSEYLKVARDRRSIKGERSIEKRRIIRGRRGIGKFAGLMVADQMEVTSRARGRESKLIIDRTQLIAANADFETVRFPFSSQNCDPAAHGTTVVLKSLNRRLSHPCAEKLRRILVLDFGRETDFSISVNGQVATLHDIPGDFHSNNKVLPVVGNIKVSFTISDGKYVVKHPGIVIKVNGKPIGEPSFFGLDKQEDVPPQVLRRVYGEVEADGLLEDVTADWGAIIENSNAYQELENYVKEVIGSELKETFEREFKLLHAKINQQIDKRLEALPEYRRKYAKNHLERILKKFYGENEDKIQAIVTLVLDAFERDEYWEVLKAIHAAEKRDVQYFADALTVFGLLELVLVGRQAASRLELLDSLDKLTSKPETLERQLHQVIDHNLWLLGSEYALVSSNKTMKTIVEKYTEENYTGEHATKRPDLLLLSEMRGSHLLIEFKRPNKTINRDDETQAQKYRDDLGVKFHPMKVLMIGGAVDKSLRLNPGNDIEYFSYSDLFGRARAEIDWLLKSLAESRSGLRLNIE